MLCKDVERLFYTRYYVHTWPQLRAFLRCRPITACAFRMVGNFTLPPGGSLNKTQGKALARHAALSFFSRPQAVSSVTVTCQVDRAEARSAGRKRTPGPILRPISPLRDFASFNPGYVLDWKERFQKDSQKTPSEAEIPEIGERREKKKSRRINVAIV